MEEVAYSGANASFAIQYQIQWFKSEPTPTKTGDILLVTSSGRPN